MVKPWKIWETEIFKEFYNKTFRNKIIQSRTIVQLSDVAYWSLVDNHFKFDMSYCCNMWFNHYTSNFNSNRMLLIFLYVFLATIQDNGILRVCYNGLLSRCKDWSIEMKTFTYMYIHVFVTDYLIKGRF